MPEFSPEIMDVARLAVEANRGTNAWGTADVHAAGDMAAQLMLRTDSSFSMVDGAPAEQVSTSTNPSTAQKLGKTGLETDTAHESETLFEFGNPLRTIDEIQHFATRREYPVKMSTKGVNFLCRGAIKVPVEAFEDYQPAPTTEEPQLTVVLLRPKDQQTLPRSDKASIRIDIASMYTAVSIWVADVASRPQQVGPTSLSFFADYLNHALPDAEPLPILKPFTPAPERTMATLEAMRPADLQDIILERATVAGWEEWLVGHDALRRFVKYTGHESGVTGAFLAIFEKLASDIAPITPDRFQMPLGTKRPIRVHKDLVSLQREKKIVKTPNGSDYAAVTTHWGIEPSRFAALIAAENKRIARGLSRSIPGYGPLSQRIIDEYIQLLTRKGLV